MENHEPPNDLAGTAKPVQDPKDDLEVHRARDFPHFPADNGANNIAGHPKHGPECYTRKGLVGVCRDCIIKALRQGESAIRAVNAQNLRTDNRVQEPSNQPSSSRPDQSTYLGTSTNVNVIPPTNMQLVEEVEEVEEDECPGLKGDIPDLEPKASNRFDKAFDTITDKPDHTEAWKKDGQLTEAEVMAILTYVNVSYGSKQVEVMDFEETYENKYVEKLRLEQLRIDKASAAFEAAELRAQEERWKLLKWWAKQLPGIPGNSEGWNLLSCGQLDDILAYCAKERKQFEKVQENLEEDMEKQRKRKGEKRECRMRIRYRLPDGTSGIMTMSKFWAFYAIKLRALDEREEELKKLLEEKEKEEKDEEEDVEEEVEGKDLDTNTNTNNAQHTQANKKDEMVPEPDSATPHNSRPKELKLGVMIPDTNDDRSTATWRIPPLYAARLRVLEERRKRLDEPNKECRTLNRCPTLGFAIRYLIRTWQFQAYWPDYANLWPELYAYILGSSSCGANSDIDASSSNDTRCLRHGQAIHEDGETPRPDSTTVPYPGPLRVSHEHRHRFFRAADELEKRLNAEKEMRESEKAENEEDEEEEEEEDDDDEDEEEDEEEEEDDEEDEEEDEEDKEEGEEEEWEDPDGLSSCKASSDINGMEVSSSDIDNLGHGQAITPKPDSTTVPHSRTAEQEYRMTFLSIPDINVAWARIASEQLLLDKERASLTHRARYLEEVKKELYGEKEVEELKKEEKEEEDEGEDPWRNHPEPVKTHAGQDESPIWTPRRGWRNHPELVETQAGQEEDLTPRRQQGEKIAYHYKMPGWTYHHPSPAWYSHHYPQTGWTYYDPMPSWSYYDLHADKISFYYPSPHLSVHNPSQTWYYYDITMGWTYCDHARAWEFLHPAPYAPHVCPENSPDWTFYRVFQCPTFVV